MKVTFWSSVEYGAFVEGLLPGLGKFGIESGQGFFLSQKAYRASREAVEVGAEATHLRWKEQLGSVQFFMFMKEGRWGQTQHIKIRAFGTALGWENGIRDLRTRKRKMAKQTHPASLPRETQNDVTS